MRVTEPYTIFPRTLKSGKTVYYYQFRDENGVRSCARSTGQTTLSGARRVCNQLYNSGKFKQRSSLCFENFSSNFFTKDSDFYKWKKVNNGKLTDETLLAYNKFLKNQLLPYFAEMQLSEITKSAVKKWIVWATEKWSAKTVNNAQTVLNIILNQAVDKNILSFNPAQGLSFRKVTRKTRILLTVNELNQIYHSALWNRESDKNLFLLQSITGLRVGEAIALQKSDIKGNYLDIKHSFSNQFGLGETKTKLCRCVPIPSDFPFPDSDGFIFCDSDGQPTNIRTFHYHFIRIMENLKIDVKGRGLTTHTLRNFFISFLRAENISDAKIKAVVGHKTSDMTDWYTFWKPEMFPEVYQAQLKLYNQIRSNYGKN